MDIRGGIGPNFRKFKSLVMSLSIERYYVWSENTVFWDAFPAISIIDIIKSRRMRWAGHVARVEEKREPV
jgi:hypothetical protein